MRTSLFTSLLFLAFLSVSSLAFATDAIPPCFDENGVIDIDNEEIIDWKRSTPNQYLDRGHALGPVVKIYPERSSHDHFSIQIGKQSGETLEVIYNKDFGALPEIKLGMLIQVCGDYITSNAPTQQYKASPDGAIIHWIHKNTRGGKHLDGFIAVDGILYGQSEEGGHGAKPSKPSRPGKKPVRPNPRHVPAFAAAVGY